MEFEYKPRRRKNISRYEKVQICRLIEAGYDFKTICEIHELKHVTHLYKIINEMKGSKI